MPEIAPVAQDPRRLRILVVDDEPLLLRSIARALRRRHQVETTTNPLEALRWIVGEGRRYDVVLTDFEMPQMTGRELLEQLRAFDPGLADRVVLVSGAIPDQRGHWPNPSLSKPFELEDLERVVALVSGPNEPRD